MILWEVIKDYDSGKSYKIQKRKAKNNMFYEAKNHTLKINTTEMDYITFGRGTEILILIPGLNLSDARGSALALAHMYRIFAKDYKVYCFDRKREIPEGYTVEDLASDIAYAMESLNLKAASVFGVSQGGMIAQYLALNHPQLVKKLVLAVTLSRTNDTVTEVVNGWVSMAEQGRFEDIVKDMVQKLYSDAYIKKYRFILPVLAKFPKPKNPQRFIILAKSCLTCSTFDNLDKIQCPVLVLGGSKDIIVTADASLEIAQKLNCEIYMYENLGHSAYEEAKDFNRRIYDFLSEH